MSRAATDWAFSQELPAIQKLVLLTLAHRHNANTGRCDPSLVRLAKDCGLDKTTVQRHLASLSERGLVTRTRRKAEGVFASTTYTLQIGVGAERTNVDAENTNPLDAQNTNGRCAEHQGVGAERTINREIKQVIEQKEEKPPLRVVSGNCLSAEKTKSRAKDAMFVLPEWISAEAWSGFVDARRKKHGAPTAHASRLIVEKLERLRTVGHDPVAVLNQSAVSGWAGVFPLREGPTAKPRAAPSDDFERKRQEAIEAAAQEQNQKALAARRTA